MESPNLISVREIFVPYKKKVVRPYISLRTSSDLGSKRTIFDQKWPIFELKFSSDVPVGGAVVIGAIVAGAVAAGVVVAGPVMIS